MKTPMRLAFRVDASRLMGTGHVMRCLTLAQEARNRGATAVFFCREHPGHLLEAVRSQGFTVVPLPAGPREFVGTESYAQWLNVSWEQDARDLLAHQGEGPFDWLVVDHYGLDARWEREVALMASRLMVIDDLANRPHACDLLLDQNRPAGGRDYADLCPPGCAILAGAAYALLRGEFLEARKTVTPRTGTLKRLLVFYGGVDLTNESSKAIRTLKTLATPCAVDVVVGSTNPHRAAVEAEASSFPSAALHLDSTRIAHLMARADLSLGAAGSTTWERAAMGLPVIATVVADNQKEIGGEIRRLGLGVCLGEAKMVDEGLLLESIVRFTQDPHMMRDCSEAGMALVDGHGAARVYDALIQVGRRT